MMVKAKHKHLGGNHIFSHDVQRLHGSAVGFMDPDLFSELCGKHKIDENEADMMFLQTARRSIPHVTLKSGSAYIPLGKQHGYVPSRGGLYQGEYHERDTTHLLRYKPVYPGNFFCTYAKDILFFAPREQTTLSFLVFTTPRMRHEDGSFHTLPFPESLVSMSHEHATVIT